VCFGILWDNKVTVAAWRKLEVFQDFCHTQDNVNEPKNYSLVFFDVYRNMLDTQGKKVLFL
jgi:hypothetical protein